ncbi:MAG: hypothetical protein R3244_01860 [Thermoanaerobaculia bacterium]|nr:hypothetical protein [Thermoanaerobaculia bacterium]
MNPHLYRAAPAIALLLLALGSPARAQETVGVGSVAPEVSLPSLDGELLSLADRRGEGPTVLVFFRGAW